MVQKSETKAINKLCVREILRLSFVCGAYFFEFRGRNLVCFVIAYNFNSKFAPEAGKIRMRTAFFTLAQRAYQTEIAFSSPEPTILLACGRDRELWFGPTPEVRDSWTYCQI